MMSGDANVPELRYQRRTDMLSHANWTRRRARRCVKERGQPEWEQIPERKRNNGLATAQEKPGVGNHYVLTQGPNTRELEAFKNRK